MIPFNRPYLTGKELQNIAEALANRKLAGDGEFSKKCHTWFEKKYGFHKALLTTSCTDALEMSALLLDILPGDEVILPSYTFVSTANAFALRGATLKFADSEVNNPNIDPQEIERLVTSRTRAIIVVHYAGVACDMDQILALATRHNIPVIEDAAQAIGATYKARPLGSFGALATLSFHETKNVHCGEGGLLVINEQKYAQRAEIIREKGTNRSSFFRGEVDKYGWVDVGSSFLPSDMLAAFLYAQLESIEQIQGERHRVWQRYSTNLKDASQRCWFQVPYIPQYASNNAHMYYLICNSLEQRSRLISHLKANNVMAVFHYLSLHKSPYFALRHGGRELPNANRYTDCLVRLPLFCELENSQIDLICDLIVDFYSK